ncbi:hypothetical protein [Pseudomonas nitroreducens]|uniref:hypothetical protein n=1 Tax=Pseudomonas nitroreducens TaxID=46680 RepID=UPI00351D92B6
MPRAIHLHYVDEWDSDNDEILCGQEGEFEARHLTRNPVGVTCKNCRRAMEKRRHLAAKNRAEEREQVRAIFRGATKPNDG